MTNKDENMDSAPQGSLWEKEEAAFLASLPLITPYRVPDGYFNDLKVNINHAIFLDGLKKSKNSGFKVPQNYFEELGSLIKDRIAVEELKALVRKDGFKTPPDYFDQLQSQIISKTSGIANQPKVVKLWHREAIKYVSAACLFIVIASGLYIKQQNEVNQIATIELANDQVLYDIDENLIFEHIEESQTASVTATSAEMESYILDNFSSSDLANNL